MKKIIVKWGVRGLLTMYAVQALAGYAIGLYIGITNPEMVERMVSCVAH